MSQESRSLQMLSLRSLQMPPVGKGGPLEV